MGLATLILFMPVPRTIHWKAGRTIGERRALRQAALRAGRLR
jgi:hypothetical protein